VQATEFAFVPLSDVEQASGAVVVVDVLRAFTTAAYAFAAGASSIHLVETVEEALARRAATPGMLAMGEVDGARPDGFDLSNSPEEIAATDLSGRALVHRTTAGTRGAVRAVGARTLLAASFVCATATARRLGAAAPERVTFVVTGAHDDLDGDEDLACAEYVAALLRGETPDVVPYLERVRRSTAGQRFLPTGPDPYRPGDLDCALAVDRFDHALVIERGYDGLVMRAVS
jgi:2-phosphosulfolactate phosphatase